MEKTSVNPDANPAAKAEGEGDVSPKKQGGIRARASKYDFVKCRVWLQSHFYYLSRYLLCRMLTVTKVERVVHPNRCSFAHCLL